MFAKCADAGRNSHGTDYRSSGQVCAWRQGGFYKFEYQRSEYQYDLTRWHLSHGRSAPRHLPREHLQGWFPEYRQERYRVARARPGVAELLASAWLRSR